ncbi:MAG: class I SAM-dependent rRNA methyltransferase [candidate division WOR-3 bacterium]
MNRITLKGKLSDYGYHPWIFKDRIKGVENNRICAQVYVNGKFLGSAFYNPEGNLALRFYSREKEEFNAGLVYKRILESISFREDILGFKSAYRLFFAESDNMPGIIADVYGKGVVIQISSYGAEKLKGEIVEGFKMAGYEFLYEKSDNYARRQEGLEPFEGFHFGGARDVIVEINGLNMIVPIGGQKTGLYLDQRLNWEIVGRIMRGRDRVLDAFSYTGGFTLHLLKNGVKRVLAVDEDDEALEILKQNCKINNLKGAETLTGNVFDMLDTFILSNDEFDGIILDPPAFAKGKNISGALKGYTRLIDRALRLVKKGGILAVFSCSHYIDYAHLEDVISRVSKKLLREVKILFRLYQSPDHPVPIYFKDSEYLRGLVCLVY